VEQLEKSGSFQQRLSHFWFSINGQVLKGFQRRTFRRDFLPVILIAQFPSSAPTLVVRRQEGRLACKKFGVGLLELCMSYSSSSHHRLHHL